MAKPSISLQSLKDIWRSQVHDEDQWAHNMKLLRATGIFVGSIVVFRSFGDLMAI